MKWALAASLILPLTACVGGAALPRAADCKQVHMIVARGTNEDPGEGPQMAISDAIEKMLPGMADSVALDYPASIFPTYAKSVATGVTNMKNMITEYAARCPESKIVLMGYSQGAQVIGDMLCGTDQVFFPSTEPISPMLGKKVVAAISMGDPTHVVGVPYNVGTSDHAGWFPRRNNEECAGYDSIRRSYCDNGDVYCDAGTDGDVHGSYFAKYGADAAAFVISKVKN
ncbi:hypothetical protein FQN49_004584 [Arthroderma sp. PD_2]|nr:hypothetical protein FQN49_004584 [Arthroderma sp. PD_2]